MRKGIVFIDNKPFPSLFALSEDEQARGLMFQKPPITNMTFVFPYPKQTKFWMKNTPAPLDIIFCSNGKIIDVEYGEPYSTTLVGPNQPSDFVIELPAGTLAKCACGIGSSVAYKFSHR